MTTILCDVTTGQMGADSCQSNGNMRLRGTKIALLDMGIAAWSADHAAGLLWVEWLNNGRNPTQRPSISGGDLAALLLDVNGALWHYEDRCIGMRVEVPLYGLGSGRDFALAAYSCGRTMLESLELAATFDLFTGPPFTIYSLKDLANIKSDNPSLAACGRG